MIEVRGVSKRFGEVLAVDDLSFTVEPGRVTGFLGPNGAGKSTTMRTILGLDRPTAGSVRIDGHRYVDDRAPLHQVGALLEARSVHPGRTAFNHLLFLARSNGIARGRVDEVLRLVGLEAVARKRTRTYSLGMGQRLGIACAMLGDPGVLLLDEPVNGLDPEGIIWVRTLLKALAAEGRTILVSSHLMAEMAMTADHLVVIGRGRLIADTTVTEFVEQAGRKSVLVRTPDGIALRSALDRFGAHVIPQEDGSLLVTGIDAVGIGQAAADTGTVLHELTPQRASLEEAFMELTRDSVEYHADEAAVVHDAVPSTEGA
jgi:ABC-2 type transport system ATP-binding protein